MKLIYVDSKDALFSVKNYCSGLVSGGLNQLQAANSLYHASGLRYVVKASLQLCEEWGFRGGLNIDMRRLFKSSCVLKKQLLIPESTLERYWGPGKRQVGEIVRKFTNLKIVKRDMVKRSTKNSSEVSQFFVGMHDLLLGLCQYMVTKKRSDF